MNEGAKALIAAIGWSSFGVMSGDHADETETSVYMTLFPERARVDKMVKSKLNPYPLNQKQTPTI